MRLRHETEVMSRRWVLLGGGGSAVRTRRAAATSDKVRLHLTFQSFKRRRIDPGCRSSRASVSHPGFSFDVDD